MRIDSAQLCDWGGVNKEFKAFNGIRIPSRSDIVWKEKTGDFTWFQCEISIKTATVRAYEYFG
ncbi:DUF6544 family protein [Paenibacillus sabinae]|uniref:DUF6544 family protein n=1 Tax=Paenibacillus sabinae TaxID=365617 RepID=UPI000A54B05E